MEKIKELKIKKLLKELDFLEGNFLYTKEIVNEADSNFMENVSTLLSNEPEIKEKYNQRLDDDIKKTIKIDKKKENTDTEPIENKIKKDPSKETKKIYREIAKVTHPDKANDELLKLIYIEATDLYNSDDKIGLYKICDKLNIDYVIDENDEEFIKYKIEDMRKKIFFLESTYTWKWLNTEDDEKKSEIILKFINMKIK